MVMSSTPDTLPSSPHSSSTSLRSWSTDVTCINETDVEASEKETFGDSASSLSKTPAVDDKLRKDVDKLVQRMVEGAQCVAAVDPLLEAALKSFNVVEQWYAETSVSGDPSFVAVANGARAAGRDYVEAVKESVKVAGLGVAFAADVMNLCDYLSKGPNAALRSFIDEMRTIAQRAQIEADATNHKFRDIRKRLVQLIRQITIQQQRIKEGPPHFEHNSKKQDHIAALELLKKASDDIGHQLDGVHKFDSWWRKAQSLISALETGMFVSYPRINPIRLEMARKGWETVRDRYEVYNRTIDTLADCYPVDSKRTSMSMLDKFIAWFTRS